MPEPDLLLKTRKWQKWHWVTLGYVRKGDTASAWLSLWGYLFLEPSCWTVKSPVPLAEVTGKILADSPSLRSQGTAKHEGASRWVSPSYHKILSKNRTAELSETIVTITKTIMTVILTNTCFSFKLLALSDLYYSSGEGNGTPLQYSGKSHGRRSLVGCCPWGREVGHDWATSLSLFTFMHWRRKWQPTPVFLPGESQGRGSLVGCRLWGLTESDTTEVT